MPSTKDGNWEADVVLRALTSKHSYDIGRNFRQASLTFGGRHQGTLVYESTNEGSLADGVYAATGHFTCLRRTPNGIYHLDSEEPGSREQPITHGYLAKLDSPSANPKIARYFCDVFGRKAAPSDAPSEHLVGHKRANTRAEGGEVASGRSNK